MKFTIPKKTFVAALTRCAAIAEPRATMPILCCALLEPCATILKVSATDLETGYTTAVDGLTWEEGVETSVFSKIAVPAKKLLECAKSIPWSDITIESTGELITISGGTASFTLGALSADEYPALPTVEGTQFEIPAPHLVQAFSQTAYAQSANPSKWHLCGTFLKITVSELEIDEMWLIAVATDGHRLAVADAMLEGNKEIPAELQKGIIIPTKGVDEICKIKTPGTILFSLSGASLCISTDSETIFIRLLEGEYPDYNRVIPSKNTIRIESPRQPLIDALERCRIITDKHTRGVLLATGDGEIALTSDLPSICGHASDKVTALVPDEPFAVRINVGYLLEALANIGKENIEITGTDGMAPIVLVPAGTDSPMHIIMPERMA